MGWIMPAFQMGTGLLGSLMGGRKSPGESLAEKQMASQAQRSEQFWRQAQAQQGKAASFYSPILGGSRTAAMEAAAPEIQGATQRMEAGRKSLLNLGSRSGGAAAQIDPYAKAGVATNILQQLRPQAAQGMSQIAGQTGGWAANLSGAPQSILDYQRQRRSEASERGKGFFDLMEQGIGGFGDWWKSRKPTPAPAPK